MIFILIVWLWGSNGNAPPIVVEHYSTLMACEQAGAVWERSQTNQRYTNILSHHVCLPRQ